MKIVTLSLLLVGLAAGAAAAQTFNDVQIRLGVYVVGENSGEKPLGVWRSTGPVAIGRSTYSLFSWGGACDTFAVSPGERHEKWNSGWGIEVTPVRVVNDAVAFRLGYSGQYSFFKPADRIPDPPSRHDYIEVTLRPGESRQVTTVRTGMAKTVDGRPCGPSASIRVQVDANPAPDEDTRLFAADLWLMEQLANGTQVQRGEPLSIRGVPNTPVSFYFDRVVDGGVPLDIFGTVTARPGAAAVRVSVETRSRWGPLSANHSGPQRSVTSEVQVAPKEVVEIKLPPLGEGAGPFAKRMFSIRIRARQLR